MSELRRPLLASRAASQISLTLSPTDTKCTTFRDGSFSILVSSSCQSLSKMTANAGMG